MDYSIKTFGAVVNLCKDLGIRHAEELSLCKPLEPAYLKKNFCQFPKKKIPGKDYLSPAPDTNSFIPTHSSALNGSNGSLDTPQNGPFSCAPVHHHTPQRQNVHGTPISSPHGVS